MNEETGFSDFDTLRIKLLREKLIYTNLNKLIAKENIFYGRAWIPAQFEGKVKQHLESLSRRQHIAKTDLKYKDFVQVKLAPPTYFQVNDFTAPFQQIVETYGIPRYQEVNPGLFAIVCFSFLFGVMFGDIGHGGLLFGFAIFITLKDADLKKTPLAIVSELRYFLLFMGFFAFYNGIIYNDFFGIPLRLFGTSYDHEFDRKGHGNCTEPIGVDPAWYMSKNEVAFLNSYKMKLSIIIGVTHMSMGICLRGLNNLYFKQYVDFVFEFIPQLVFMLSTFGYMCVVIVIKWLQNWEGHASPPSILNIYTQMGFTVSLLTL